MATGISCEVVAAMEAVKRLKAKEKGQGGVASADQLEDDWLQVDAALTFALQSAAVAESLLLIAQRLQASGQAPELAAPGTNRVVTVVEALKRIHQAK